MSGYEIAHVDQIDVLQDDRLRPVRHHFGIRSFGATAWTGREVGDRVINEHDEDSDSEELYLVLSGRARFELDGEAVDAPAGTFVSVRPSTTRTAFAEEPETTILVVGGTVGKAYEANGWELWAPLRPLYEQGKTSEVVEKLRAVVEANPGYALLVYNLACLESLAGRHEDAIAHLGQAVEMSERFRDFERGDSDLDPLRDDPRFAELVAAPES